MNKLSARIALLVLCSMFAVAREVAAEPDGAVHSTCVDLTLPVTLAEDRIEVFRVVGTLCWSGALGDQTVQVLVHGTTATRIFWDLPMRGELYSYVRRATQAGFATFNVERIGIGASDHPPAADVTITSNAFVIHQIVQALRDGTLVGVHFERVLGVGHSLGSRILTRMQAQFPDDLDGLILTGTLHDDGPELAGILRAFAIPASLDPRFAVQNLPPGYFTLRDGLQLSFLVNPDRADPEIVNFHESLKETTTTGELGEPRINGDSRLLDVPVLLLVGERDRVLCGNRVDCSSLDSILALERDFYGPETCLQVEILRESGHLFTLQRSPQGSYSTMLQWARRFIGVDSRRGPETRCPSGSAEQ